MITKKLEKKSFSVKGLQKNPKETRMSNPEIKYHQTFVDDTSIMFLHIDDMNMVLQMRNCQWVRIMSLEISKNISQHSHVFSLTKKKC